MTTESLVPENAPVGNVQLTHDAHTASRRTYPIRLLAQDVEDPVNVGSLFRLADALGVRHIYLTGNSAMPPNAKLRRAARATEQYVSWSYAENPLLLMRELKCNGILPFALEITSGSVDVRFTKVPSNTEIVLIVGSENRGVSQCLLDEVAETVHIPMNGHNSSMNVAIACAIAVFELTKDLSAT